MRPNVFYLTACLIVGAVCHAYCIGLPAGTNIELVANATYSSSQGNVYTAEPAYATLIVGQVASVKLNHVSTNIKNVLPGQDVYLPIVIANNGNGTDSFKLSVSSDSGWSTSVIQDDNGDGIHQDTEDYVISNTSNVVADGFTPCFIKVNVPASAKSGDTIKIAAVSNTIVSNSDILDVSVPPPAMPTVTITAPTASNTYSTNSAKLNIAGTATGNTLKSVAWSNSTGASGTCSGTTSWSANNIALKPGNNVITITATDSYSNQGSNVLTVSLTDKTAPTISIVFPTVAASYISALSTITLSGTASDDVEVSSVNWSSDKGNSGTCIGKDSWSVSGIALTQGINLITISAYDTSGNPSTDVLSVNYDTSAPEIKIVSPSSNGSYDTLASKIDISGTSTSVSEMESVKWSSDKGGSGTCIGTNNWSASGITLSGGKNIITVTAKDQLGKSSSAQLAVNCDIEAPVIKITSPTTGSTYSTNQTIITLSGTATDDMQVKSVKLKNTAGLISNCTGTSNWVASGILLNPGDNVLTVTATDNSGKSSDAVIAVYCTQSTIPNVIEISYPTKQATFSTKNASINLAGSVTGDAEVASVSWLSDKGVSGYCTGTTSWTISGIALALGNNSITVTATDKQGKTVSDNIVVTYDTDAPTITITSPTGLTSYTTSISNINLAGTASSGADLAEITWTTDKGASGSCSGLQNWSATGIALAEGSNVITIIAKDALNRTSSASITVISNPAAFKIEITSPTTESSYARNTPLLVLGGTSYDPIGIQSVSWSIDNGASGVCSGTDNWVVSDLNLNIGKNVITVVATNNRGETKSASVEVEVIESLPGDAWRGLAMVSLPIIPDNSDPKQVVEFLTTNWSTFVTESNSYSVYPEAYTWFTPKDNTPGRGFWARFSDTEPEPYGTIPDQTKAVTISLKTGWNLIGQPFINPVIFSLSNLMVSDATGATKTLGESQDAVAMYVWGWQQNADNPLTGSYYLISDKTVVPDACGEMQPWQGYWFKAYKDCNLIIPAP